MKLFYTILVALILFVAGCDCHEKAAHQTVHVYKQSTNAVPSDSSEIAFIYWYVMCLDNTYYYNSSSTYIPPSSYSTLNWSSSKVSPINVSGKPVAEEVEENTVENEDLGQEMDQTIETTEASETSGSESSSSSDSSSSSGGDSGGGDGGGGGGD